MNTIEKTKNILPLYLPALLIPIAITGGLLLLYSFGMGNMYPNTLSLFGVIFSGLASLNFAIYLQKSEQHRTLSVLWRVLASISYGLCSHALLPTTEYSSQFIFVILPLLILSYNAFIFKHQTKSFVIILSLCLFICPITTSSIIIGLIFAFFFFTPQKGGTLIADFCHLLLLYALSICVSAAVSLPAYKDWFRMASEQDYAGFSLAQPFTNFVSRFLPGSIPTTYYTFSRNVCLYFGLFFFFMFVIYFFHNEISFKERIKTLGFVSVIACAIEFSPLRFIFELFTENSSYFIYFECLLIFWSINLATKTIASLTKIKWPNLLFGLLCSALTLLFGYSGSYLNFHSTALMSTLVFVLFYTICILCLRKQLRVGFIEMLLCLFIFIELFCNSFLITNINIFPTTPVAKNNYIWTQFMRTAPSAELENNNIPSVPVSASTYEQVEAQYNDFAIAHRDTSLTSLLSSLLANINLTDDDYKAYGIQDYTNQIEQLNAICRKIGASENLFIPAETELSFPLSDYYQITPQGGGVYNLFQHKTAENLPALYVEYQFVTNQDSDIILYSNFSQELFRIKNCKAGELQTAYIVSPINTNYSYNFRLITYYLNSELYQEIPSLLAIYQEESAQKTPMTIYYLGISGTCLGVLIVLILYFNRDASKLYIPLHNIKTKFGTITARNRLSKKISSNYVYILAFAIPVTLYLLSMIIFSCIPFGNNSFYDEDGIASSLPAILAAYYNIQDGNTIYSMNGGYGYSVYTTNTTFFTQAIFNLLPLELIAPLVLLLVGIAYGLTSVSIVYYLTHRLSGVRAHKKDYRLLIPAFIYTLNTYMLACHNFHTWYYIFVALPLILLAMDYLMYKKTWGLYVISLGICMFTTIHVSLFVCIFLVMHFFTYHFDSIKDFFAKGFRFAFYSLLTAGCNFFMISETFSSKSNSFYQDADSIFPAFGFHTSFFNQWKQLFIFTPSMAVNPDNGHINLYMGIFTLVLLGLYLTSKRIPIKEKIKKLLPIAFLTISFNEQILSYIWNGFHYQSSVPNRYVFLLMFLCAIISYDVIRELKHVTIVRHLTISCLLIGFLIICHVSNQNTTLAFVTSLILIGIYAIIHIIYKTVVQRRFPYYKIVTTLLLIELCANMFFTTSNYALSGITFMQSFEQLEEYADKHLYSNNSTERVSTPGSYQLNTGCVYNVPSGSFFNSFVSAYQSNMHYLYGFYRGKNFCTYNYNSTPLGLTLSGHKYIFLPFFSSSTLTDTFFYDYIGSCTNYYIYENPDALSLGIYVPDTIRNIGQVDTPTPVFQNELVSLYIPQDEPLYNIQIASYSSDGTQPNSYSYLDGNKNPIEIEEMQEILNSNISSVIYPLREINLHLNLAPQTDGMNYLYLNQFIPLSNGNAGESFTTDTIYPGYYENIDSPIMFATFNEEVYHNFIAVARKNQMEEVHIENNYIHGITRYETDGYTMLSLPYDSNWHAYVDGTEVAIECPFGSFMIFETPAGEHNIELIYEHSGMKIGVPISIGCIVLAILLYLLPWIAKKHNTKDLPTTPLS